MQFVIAKDIMVCNVRVDYPLIECAHRDIIPKSQHKS